MPYWRKVLPYLFVVLPCIYLWYFSYIFGILPYIYSWGICGLFICRVVVHMFVIFSVYIYIFGLLPQGAYRYIYLWYYPCIYIWTIAANRYIFVVLPYTYWSCFRRYLCHVAAILDALPIYWLYCRIYLFS